MHRQDVKFEIGDWVYLKLRPHRQQYVAQRINKKLAPRYYGPFQIKERFGPVVYELKLPASSKIHPVFHASLLKRAVATRTISAVVPTEFTLEEPDTLLPYKILAHRSIKLHGDLVKQFLIQWDGKPMEEATWEEELVFKGKFPTFSLDDKPVLDGGGVGVVAVLEKDMLKAKRRVSLRAQV